ncbi:glutamine amidotransferase [Naumannella cuiyingiana]|uniref:GMP synthase (Glutamine-hydrolyzing) n=1 Tax=Naumannella cuiyingiana TaxID=1347891 RepID=A0A7Z0IJV9_9ACTN|nr:glutamine amidotransferase [Naumannella cuiyingiana]NYI69964.1 GMP synthase (glutamine-hydrolyzing) [Naumannella cuiyingiana]
MRPFVLLATRDHDEAADDEYASYLSMGGLAADELVRVRLERDPLPGFELAEVSGFILAGSPFNASDPDDRKSPTQLRVETELGSLLRRVVAHDFPFLGVCYGVGTLGRLLGATIDRRFAEITNEVTVTLTADGRADPVCAGLAPIFRAFVGHKEAVSALPEGAVLLARGEACPVQLFRYGANGYATQFHPELDGPAFARRIDFYRDAGYYPPERAEELIDAALASPANSGRLIGNFVERYRR